MEQVFNRREALSAGLQGVAGATLGAELLFGNANRALAQNYARYFNADLSKRFVPGLGTDKLLPKTVFDFAARYLDEEMSKTDGKLLWVNPKNSAERYELQLRKDEVARATNLVGAFTRDTCRHRAYHKDTNPTSTPTREHLEKTKDIVLGCRSFYASMPLVLSVYACDNERGGRSFGTKPEVDAYNKANAYHGVPNMQGPIRQRGQFLDLIRKTPPTRLKSGDLIFGIGFNGHGAPGGEGMSMLSAGASRLSSSLMTGDEMCSATEEHLWNHRDLYLRQAESKNRAYFQVSISCCYSQDQVRNNGVGRSSGSGRDMLSRFEDLTSQYRVRFCVITESETMRPGYYQPGKAIPALLAAALARVINRKGGDLRLGDLEGAIEVGGAGILSNPSIFVTDRKTSAMHQIG